MTALRVTRAGPLCTLQDAGRFGLLRHGISASGPMDRAAFERAGEWMGGAGAAGIEITTAGIAFVIEGGALGIGLDGGDFGLECNGRKVRWPARLMLREGDAIDITPGVWGNYGYLRFDREVDVAPVLGSVATNTVAALGGVDGRSLQAGDRLRFGEPVVLSGGRHPRAARLAEGPIRVLWGLHADLIDRSARRGLVEQDFRVSPRIDRMGARLDSDSGVFRGAAALSLVSDAIVPGDIQILGDGTPIVLLRDHQPTGGYARIATIISADFDRFVQLRPGSSVRFEPVTLAKAHAILAGTAA